MALKKIFTGAFVMANSAAWIVFGLVQAAIHFELTERELWPAIVCGVIVFPGLFAMGAVLFFDGIKDVKRG